MAEEFHQGGVCGGNWCHPSRSLFGSSPCAMAINDIGSFGWLNHDNLVTDMRSTTRSSDNSPGSASDSCTQQQTNMSSMDSTNFQMMFPSSTTADNWDQNLVHNNGSSDENYSNNNILQEATGLMNSSTNCPNFSENFPLQRQQQPLNPITREGISPSSNFPLNSASYSAYASSLLQTLFDTDSQESLLDNHAMNYSSAPNYGINSSQMLTSFPKASNNNTVTPPSFAKQPTSANHLPFWNATAAAMTDVRSSFLPSVQPQLLPSSLNNKECSHPSFTSPKNNNKEARNLASVSKKASNIEPAFKRPRIETPSPLPTFKVRKEKLGDRITALQQLVSPFGKTDTASVLYEAIEYIKFLHDQVRALSTPYLKSGSQRQEVAGKLSKDQQEAQKQDLRSRGLCLVPISSTFPVAAETSSDFWTPTFGATFR